MPKNKKQKRKICFVLTNRVHYARQKLLLEILRNDPDVELQIVMGGSMVIPKYGDAILKDAKKSKFKISDICHTVIEGGNNIAMTKTAGLTLLEFAGIFQRLDPDIVVVRGDRFEVLPVATAAAYLNKTIAHIEGGDVSGTIDESVRHAVTKLSHVHFVTNEKAKERVLRMGECPQNVCHTGSLDAEYASSIKKEPIQNVLDRTVAGANIDILNPFIMVMQHPVTTEKNNGRNIQKTLEAVLELNIQALWFWPNMDAGTDEMSKAIRMFREHENIPNISFAKELPPDDFIALLKHSACIVGNSSSGIKEASFLGIPSVNIGSRQNNRTMGENVFNVGYDKGAIKKAILRQLKHGPYEPSKIYFKKGTSRKIARVLKTVRLQPQKYFYE